MKAAIFQQPLTLEHASQRLQGDAEVVRFAVAKDGYALRYASPQLQEDLDIVHMALAQRLSFKANPDATVWIRLVLPDSAFFLAKVQDGRFCYVWRVRQGYALTYVAEKLRADPDVVKLALQKAPRALASAADSLKADKAMAPRTGNQNLFLCSCGCGSKLNHQETMFLFRIPFWEHNV